MASEVPGRTLRDMPREVQAIAYEKGLILSSTLAI
jgi:hypothetical protein